MNRLQIERDYWENAGKDDLVDIKYIADVPDFLCKEDLGKLEGEVLEIGCGVGRLLEKDWWGIDISQSMLKIANIRRPECRFKQTDGRTVPFNSNYFDNVYCYLVFQHLPLEGVKSYVDEAYRVLKTGGKFTFQFIVGTEKEPFSNHLTMGQVDSLTKKFSSVSFNVSKAYRGWTIARCVK